MRLLTVALGCIGLALLVEAIARAVARVQPEPLRWHDLFTQRKQDQMRALRRTGGVDLVLVGASTMLYGVDPDVIRARTGLSTYNASIYRGVPTVSEAWLDDVVLDELRPAYVVIGVSPLEVNDNSPLVSRYDEYRAAKVFTAGPVRRLHWALGRHSVALRHIGLLRRPRRLLQLVAQVARQPASWSWHVPAEIDGELGPNGRSTRFLDREYGHGPRMYELIRSQAAVDYANAGVQWSAARRMAAAVRARGGVPVYAAMPFARELLDEMFMGGRAAFAREWARLRADAAHDGVPVIDVADGFEDHRYYADMVHLNGAGQAEFSRRLGDALAELLGLRTAERVLTA